jgi:hypothetical protein
MIGVSLVILFYTIYIKYAGTGRIKETFAEDTTNTPTINDYKPILLEEDLNILVPVCSVYITVFNIESYPESGQEWYNVAYQKRKDCFNMENKVFSFQTLPAYTRKSGILLGTNRLFGPYSNMLNISLQSTFTIFMVCKHGDFVANNPQEIELLKLYANSNDNNGLAFFIKAQSINVENNIQSGNLLLKFTDTDTPAECKLNTVDTSFIFDKANPSFYFIVKEMDKIRVLYMNGALSKIYQLASVSIKETNATFSNKEMIINRFSNWKGNIYNFGVINEAIDDSTVTNIHQHIYSEYLKATSDEYIDLSNNYNNILAILNKFTQCPFDEDVCKSCNMIKSWTDTQQIVAAPLECRDAINKYCTLYPKHPFCRCWDSTYYGYASDSCRMFKNIFNPNAKMCDDVTPDDLSCIKKKYDLIFKNECPKQEVSNVACSKDLIKNQYSDYDYQRLKVNPDSISANLKTVNFKVDSPYFHEPVDDSDKKATMNYYSEKYRPTNTKGDGKYVIDQPYKDKNKDKNDTANNTPNTKAVTKTKEAPAPAPAPPSKEKVLEDSLANYSYKPIRVDNKEREEALFSDALHPYRVPSDLTNAYKTDGNIDFDLGKTDTSTSQETVKTQATTIMDSLMSFFLPA